MHLSQPISPPPNQPLKTEKEISGVSSPESRLFHDCTPDFFISLTDLSFYIWIDIDFHEIIELRKENLMSKVLCVKLQHFLLQSVHVFALLFPLCMSKSMSFSSLIFALVILWNQNCEFYIILVLLCNMNVRGKLPC